MATCMECIHFNPCNMNGKIIVEKPTEGNDWGLHNEVEKECKYFTLTADVAEVVRCKDCSYCQNASQGYLCLRILNITDGMHFVYNKPNDFCSYGERRDT